MTDSQVAGMLKDVEILKTYMDAESVSIAADVCLHVKALADERERLLEGYRQMVQIVSSAHQWHYKVAKAILEGADLRVIEECEALAAKYARKT